MGHRPAAGQAQAATRRAASRHVVDAYFCGEGAPDMCGIPTRRLSWATQQLASSWPGAGVQSVPVEPEIIIGRPGEFIESSKELNQESGQ
jgi:hypothetical protein